MSHSYIEVYRAFTPVAGRSSNLEIWESAGTLQKHWIWVTKPIIKNPRIIVVKLSFEELSRDHCHKQNQY